MGKIALVKNSEKYPNLKISQRVVIDNHFYCDKCDMCDEGACHMCPIFKHYGFGGGVDQGEVYKLILVPDWLRALPYEHQFENRSKADALNSHVCLVEIFIRSNQGIHSTADSINLTTFRPFFPDLFFRVDPFSKRIFRVNKRYFWNQCHVRTIL